MIRVKIRINTFFKYTGLSLCIAIAGMAAMFSVCSHVSADGVLPEATSEAVEEASMTPVPTGTPESTASAVPGETVVPAPTQASAVTPVPAVTVVPAVTSMPAVPAEPSKPPCRADIRLSRKSVKLYRGETVAIKLTGITPSDSVKWSAGDSDIVSVNKKGHIRALTAGKTIVKAVVNSVTYKCRVTVRDAGIDYTSFEMEEGGLLRLHIGGAWKVKWTTSNKKVACVTDGRVSAVKCGNAVIKAVTKERTYTCSVVVSKKTKGVIYLTFDDGPTLSSTPKILDILRKNKVHATFFTIGMDSTKAALIKREAKEGHSIAIHGASHEYNEIYSSDTAYMNNIKKQQKALKKLLGYNVWITRFPGGSSNLVSRSYNRGIMGRLVKTVNNAGFAYFDWNVSSNDAGGAKNSSQVYKSVTRGLSKNRDNVVLMHDFANNNKTIGALEGIIRYGKSHGYEFRTINAATAEVHHGVQN